MEVQLTFEKPLARKNRSSKGGFRRSNHKRGNGKFDNKNRRSKVLKVNQVKRKIQRNLTVEISNKNW